MMNMKKLISMLLAMLMMLSALTVMFTVEAFADDAEDVADTETSGSETESGDDIVEVEEEKDYIKEIYATPGEKLATMRLALEKDGFQLYIDDYSGEVACVNTLTGERIFTNPYDVGASTGNETTKAEILSQIIVKFTDKQGQDKTFTSYTEAVLREQVVTEPIKNGLRVEYTIGREQTKTLVPRLITKERFDEMILKPLYEAFGEALYEQDVSDEVFQVQRFLTYFTLYSKEPLDMTDAERTKLHNATGGVYDNLIDSPSSLLQQTMKFPIIDSMPVYVFKTEAKEAEVIRQEEIVMTYCPGYTYEELEYDHSLTEYESEDENPPVFRMALEYKIEDGALSVRLPANGIRFNESLYTLNSIEVLPYMGAGSSGYAGYNFFPDGSGTLFDYEELNTNQTRSVVGKVYGTDFAYHEITGTYQKSIRYPVFGMVEESNYYTYTETDPDTGDIKSEDTIAGALVDAVKAYNAGEDVRVCKGREGTLDTKYGSIINNDAAVETKTEDKHGFLAIIEEGDALASLTTYHAGSLSDYNTIKMSFTPRPKDSYNLQDSISVGSNDKWTVVSDRKYVGGYKIRYVLLSDADEAVKKGQETYDASWLGMAIAYRDYLTDQGIISKLTSDDVKSNIPLYVEAFGAVETTEKILSVPVTVMAPLTTFEDVIQMYTELAEQNITNVNFKLTGFANGGMYYHVPGKLKFEKEVGGNKGFQALLDKANEVNETNEDANFGIFPDFDLAYSLYDQLFDGYSNSKHAARTIDDRYAAKRVYSATQQKYMNYYELAISPAYYSEFYNKLEKNYLNKYENVMGISVASLGYALNSDFDEDEPYNREDSKDYTIKAFEALDESYGQVMTEGGNAYVWKYIDHLLDVSLDSSRYNFSANAVPFIGVVLHGSISFAGEPLNMEGDIDYAILKAIENGASPYFILSARNTQALKQYTDLSQYYSIRYDIWNKDIADVYNTLNTALADVQDKYITNHEFLIGERVPDTDELEADIYNEYLADLAIQKNISEILEREEALAASIAREYGREAEQFALASAALALDSYAKQMTSADNAVEFNAEYYNKAIEAYQKFEAVRAYSSYSSSNDPSEMALYAEYRRTSDVRSLVTDFNMTYAEAEAKYDAEYAKLDAVASYADHKNDYDKLVNSFRTYANEANTQKKEQRYEALKEQIAEIGENASKYIEYLATKNAVENTIKAGFVISFEDCYEVCLKVEETVYYSNFKTTINRANAYEDDKTNYASYVAAQKALTALTNEISAAKPAKGTVDNYVLACAQLEVMTALGYDQSTDSTLTRLYRNAYNQRNNARNNAINAVTITDATNLKDLKTLLETLEEYYANACVAIETLAEAENVAVVYADGADKTAENITNYDEIAGKSLIVKQAIDRAMAVYDAIEGDKYVELEDGRSSEYTLNGYALRYKRNDQGQKIYFYGTKETGYSYFTRKADGTFDIYHMGAKTGYFVDEAKTLEIYSYREGSKQINYTATLDGGYTYYVQDTYYSTNSSYVYVEQEATVYNGVEVETLEDGTVLLCDSTGEEPVYYAVNADGTYKIYTYYMSVRDFFETAQAAAKTVKDTAFEMTKIAGDDEFADAVQKRIDRNNTVVKEEEEEVVVEEASRYTTENIVAVTYGDNFKTIILNYNDYSVNVVYGGIEYTIPAYEFVIVK